jgi:ribosome-binding factor A
MRSRRQLSRRPDQVAATVRQAVTDALIRGEVRDPRVGLLTVTDVRVTNDLGHARVLVALTGEEADRQRALQGLQSAAGFLRSKVARALSTRTVPELHFELDRGFEHAARIETLLGELKRGPTD